MKNFILTLLFLELFCIQIFSQTNTFIRSYSKGYGYNVINTKDRGYLIGDYVISASTGIKLLKTDSSGNLIWEKSFDLFRPGYSLLSLYQHPDGGYSFAAVKDINEPNLYLLRLNESGDTIWTKKFTSDTNFDFGVSYVLTNDNGFLIVGSHSNGNVVIYKTDTSGNLIWQKIFEFSVTSSNITNIQKTYDDNFIIYVKHYLFKFTDNGDSLWAMNLTKYYNHLTQANDSGFVLCGDGFIIKTDKSGNIKWTNNYSGWRFQSVLQERSNDLVLVGGGILKIDSEGNNLLELKNPNVYYSVQNTDEGGLLISGSLLGSPSGGYVCVVKTNENGDVHGIGLTSFNVKDTYEIGREYTLTWYSQEVSNVNIDLTTDEGASWINLASNIPDEGSYKFIMPGNISDKCKMKVSDANNPSVFCISMDYFTLLFNSSFDYIAVNQIKMWERNNGSGSFNPITESAGFYWPGGENATITASFADGLVWGGNVNGEIRVNGNTHRAGLLPGKILPDGKAGEPVLIWKILKYWQNIPAGPVRDKYEYNYNNWPGDLGAPYIDVDKDGKFTKGIDQPRFLGDEVLWFAANDLDTITSRFTYGSDPIGLEEQVTTFGYDKQDDLADVIFKKYKIINKSGKQIDDMYLAYWADPDLGDANDDYVGCDTTLNLGYCYNGNNNDAEYGVAPPAIGYQFVQGPINKGSPVDSARINDKWRKGEKNLPMTAFSLYIGANSTYQDPNQGQHSGALMFYNNMQGLIWNGNRFTDPITNLPTKFVLPGDPVSGVGWYEGKGWPIGIAPRDARFLMSSGPFNFAPADTQEIVLAIIMARGTDNINSVAELKRKARVVQEFYDSHIPTSMKDNKILPDKFELYQNYPNPFNPSTTIKYSIPPVGTSFMKSVQLKVYDILGREIATLVNEKQNPGIHNYTFSIINYKLSSGVYFYRLVSGNYNQTKKMIILK